MASALRKLFRLKSKSSVASKSPSNSKDSNNKRSKKSLTSSSPSPLSPCPSLSPHQANNSQQSNRICLGCAHSQVHHRNHQIVPAMNGTVSCSSPSSSSPTNNANNKPCTIRTRRLMKEYKELCKISQSHDKANSSEANASPFPPFSIELVNDCLFEWNIKVYQFDTDSQFYHDMKELGIDFVLFNATFPDNYPFAPPFVRVVSPHIEKGFVMEGGAICLELLTRHGWASAYTMEAVVMQLTASFVKGQARIRKNKGKTKEFSKKTAEASFRNVIKIHDRHGWVNPPLTEG